MSNSTLSLGKLSIVVAIFSLIASQQSLLAQIPAQTIIWQKPVGGTKHDEIRDMVNTPDGGCVFTGFTNSIDGDVAINKGDDDLMVCKLDAFGNIEWIKTYGGSGQEWGRSIKLTRDGGYIIGGHNTSQGDLLDVTGNHGGFDYWVLKLNSKGELQWQQSFGGSLLDLGYSIDQTDDGGYIAFGGVKSIDGNVTGKNTVDADYWLVKLDFNGNILWQRTIGGPDHEEGSSARITTDGGLIISGFTSSNSGDVTGNHGTDDVFMVKTDSLGNIDWARCYGGSLEDAARDACQTSDGGYVFAGYTNSDDGDVSSKHNDQDIWVVKLDSIGNIIWEKAFGGNSLEYAYSIEENIDHTGYLVAGHTGSTGGNVSGNNGLYDIWVFELDLNGKLVWQKCLGGSDNDYGRTITQTLNGDYLVAGYTSSIDSDVVNKIGGSDGWIVKLKGDCFNQTFYQDADGDKYGNPSISIYTCDQPVGYIYDNTDCNDADAAVFPNTIEVCNGYDDDCDFQSDEDIQTTYYGDADGDTYGDPSVIKMACSIVPAGYTTNNSDCDDSNAGIKPGVTETCNSFDDDCNGAIDEPAKIFSYTADISGIPASVSANSTATNLIRVNGAMVTTICETGFSSKNFATANAFNNSLPAVELTMTPASGYQLQLASFSADLRRNSNGPSKVRFAYSLNGGNTWIDQGSDFTINNSQCGAGTPSSWDFADFTLAQTIIFRIYGYGAVNAAGVLQLLNVSINGTVCLMFDEDHDGYIASLDCNDGNASIHPNAIEKCNAIDDDCDTEIDEGAKTTFYADADHDGYGNLAVTSKACSVPQDFSPDSSDCNDLDAAIHPGSAEVCNGIDENCDTQIDNGVLISFYADTDNDNFGDPNNMTPACLQPSGYVLNNSDCNDANTAISPSATETCNGVDDNCDAFTDEPVRIYHYVDNTSGIPVIVGLHATASNLQPANGVFPALGTSGCPTGYTTKNYSTALDFSTSFSAVQFTITQNSGYQINGSSFSVDLRRSGSGPKKIRMAYSVTGGSNWVDEGVDHDIISNSDCGVTTNFQWDFPDFATGQPLIVRIYGFQAGAGSGTLQVLNARLDGNICQILDADNDTYNTIVDCNDANPTIHPNALESCNTVDDNCNSEIDEGVKLTFYADADNDAFGNAAITTLACTPPAGYVSSNTDCNDAVATVYPGAPEQCNDVDDNCDNQFDEGASATFYLDTDNDGYGSPDDFIVTCPAPPGYAPTFPDCNNNDASINPGATEICNLVDDDCDAATDEDVELSFYLDDDNDAFGNPAISILACVAPPDYVPSDADCNDADSGIHPNIPETCNNIDDNCNGILDEAVQIYHYVDNTNGTPLSVDADATATNLIMVNGATTSNSCPTGFSTKNFPDSTLFDTTLPAVEFSILANSGYQIGASSISANVRRSSSGPSTIRLAYSLDNGASWIDEGVNHSITNELCGVTNSTIWDFDDFITSQNLKFRFYGFNASATTGTLQLLDINFNGNVCHFADDDGDGFNTSVDCDDNNAFVYPNAPEICNGVDDNCNADLDEGVKVKFYTDADNDTYGNSEETILACNASTGFVADSTDCNDMNVAIHPNTAEICNGLDEDCNNQIDEGVLTIFYADNDHDTYGTPSFNILACTLPANYSLNDDDCNDANPAVNPSGNETCNGIDDNCNGTKDEQVAVYKYTTNTSGIPSLISANATATNVGAVNGAALSTGCPTGLIIVNFTNAANYSTSLPAIEFTLNPLSGFQIEPAFFTVDLRRTGNGPSLVRFAYSIDNGNNWINQGIDHTVLTGPCGGTTTFTWDVNDFITTQPIKFRIFGFKASKTSGMLQVLNLTLTGKVCPLSVDADSDGYDALYDCNDNDPKINPGTVEICNTLDDNCDGQTDEGVTQTFYADNDHDNYGDPAISVIGCNVPDGFVTNNADCNDGLDGSAFNPDVSEICNSLDDNCNSQIDEGVSTTSYADTDLDGYGNAAVSFTGCFVQSGYVLTSSDCNDSNPSVNPVAKEICNLIDDDCDALIDEPGDIYHYTDNHEGIPDAIALHATGTNFKLVNGAITTVNCPTGFLSKNYSTAFNFSTSVPAIEFTIVADPGYRIEASSFTAALRRNGGGPSKIRFAYSIDSGFSWITQETNQALQNAECGVMTNSSWDFPDFFTTGQVYFRIYGFDASSTSGMLQVQDVIINGNACKLIFDDDHDGYNTTVDCDDSNPAIFPNATEVCNDVDDNCDSQIDENLKLTFYADADNDSYGNLNVLLLACFAPAGYVSDNTDCNDAAVNVHPMATEICNFIDDDCDTQIDENVVPTYYLDNDNDSYGNQTDSVITCFAPAGYVPDNTDCNDANGNIHPNAAETCNNIDDNCSGSTDEATTIYSYTDNSSGAFNYVDINASASNLSRLNGADKSTSCPTGFSSKNFVSTVEYSTSLGAVEFSLSPLAGYKIEATSFTAELRRSNSGPASIRFAYSLDNGVTWIDQGFNQSLFSNGCGLMTPTSWDFSDFSTPLPLKFRIFGFNAVSTSGVLQIMNVNLNGKVCPLVDLDADGYESAVDCNDTNALINPGAIEVCNNVDDNCDAQVDENVKLIFYADADGDTYGDSLVSTLTCLQPVGYSSDATDCNDGNAAINPAQAEMCNNVDDNCDGITDEAIQAFHYTTNTAGVPASFAKHSTVTNLILVNGVTTATGSGACLTGTSNKGFTSATTFATSLPAVQFTITPDSAYQVDAGTFSAEFRKNGGGPASLRFAYSKDGGNSWIDQGINQSLTNSDCGVMTSALWDFDDFSTYQPLVFRVYGFNASSTSGILQLLNINLVAKVCLIPDLDNDGYNLVDDCDDTNPAIHPNAPEACNSIDDNCDSQIDETGDIIFYADADNDSYGNPNVTKFACTTPIGYVANNNDCNDSNAAIQPLATETCNTVDDNCNGTIDEASKIYNYTDNTSGIPFYLSTNVTATNLKVVNGAIIGTAPAACPTGFSSKNFPVTTTYAATLPAVEFTLTPATDYRIEAQSWSVQFRKSAGGPGSLRLAYSIDGGANWIDQGSNLSLPNNTACGVMTTASWDFADFYLEQPLKFRIYGFNASNITGILQLMNVTVTGKVCFVGDADGDGFDVLIDCNDNNPAIYPDATEVCNGIDDDCDTQTDENVKSTFYADDDHDSYGNPAFTTLACMAPVGFVADSNDCNDANVAVNPTATEICNSIDDDCDSEIDENVILTFYVDSDNDGYGNPFDSTTACVASAGYAANNTDCNDDNMNVNPGASEICNGLDDNCDTQIDENLIVTFYSDDDNDSYGNLSVATTTCSAPDGYVADSTDCDDSNADIHPNVVETCNLIDDNCNGTIDEDVIIYSYTDNITGTPFSFAANSTGGSLIRVNGAKKNTQCPTGFSSKTFSSAASFNTDLAAIEFAIAPLTGYQVEATSFSAELRRNNKGPASVRFAYSPDNGTTWIDQGIDQSLKNKGCGVMTVASWNFSDFSSSVPIKFRIYGFKATGTSGVLQVMNITLNGNVCQAVDEDGDGFDARVDCDDNNLNIFPGAIELCNGLDDNCDLNIDENSIEVFVTALGETNICSTGFVKLKANGGSGLTYQWYKDDLLLAGKTNQTYKATVPGTYKVLVTNLSFCSNTSTPVNVFSFCKEDSVAQLTKIGTFLLYPNPTRDNFVIELTPGNSSAAMSAKTIQANISITNLFGQIVYAENIQLVNGELKKEIKLSDSFIEGMYLVKVILNDETATSEDVQWTGRIMIQK